MVAMMNTETAIDLTQAWKQVLSRDPEADFFYGVTTTGVFCRTDCSSRRPLLENTRFFRDAADAQAAGFRACQRCRPEEPRPASVVARMCAYLERRADRQVRLAELGKLAGISPFTAQRVFKQAMGVSPAQYQRAMRAHAFRDQLRSTETTVTTAIYEAGYGSSSRAYEPSPLGMTPGRFVAGGRGETIGFAIAASANLGSILVAATERGVCWVSLGDSDMELESGLRAEFPAATIRPDEKLGESVAFVLKTMQGGGGANRLPLDLRGTAFQLRVWSALQQIPLGETRSYSQLAAELGNPKATRAVARACATNRVAVLVPCHRVVGASGSLTGYRWGVERKRELLAGERRA